MKSVASSQPPSTPSGVTCNERARTQKIKHVSDPKKMATIDWFKLSSVTPCRLHSNADLRLQKAHQEVEQLASVIERCHLELRSLLGHR